jgi:hypothetical protein
MAVTVEDNSRKRINIGEGGVQEVPFFHESFHEHGPTTALFVFENELGY